jgi:tetratricopeptide (TPR) repeat protein
MKPAHRIFRYSCVLFFALAFVWACPFDNTLREYLDAHFWLPFSKFPNAFEKRNVRRVSAPFAGMVKAQGTSPLDKLRTAYQEISQPSSADFDSAMLEQTLAAARADQSLTRKDREEVDLIDAKIDMRLGEPDEPEPLQTAKKKLQQFLKTARTPEFLSEARGWLAHVDYLLGDQTAAGKIYLDELNRSGSNLSRETLLNSLHMNYGYDGGPQLLEHLEEYFDTPEHAAFAIQLATNPRWHDDGLQYGKQEPRPDPTLAASPRIQALLEKHSDLLKSESGANALALLGMRAALRAGDPPAALKIAEMVPADAAIRTEPDFSWMLASANFLSHDFGAAEQPLLDLFHSSRSSVSQKSAAAYGLCGVYRKTGNTTEQIRFALWLRSTGLGTDYAQIADQSIYWATSGWDLSLLLDTEAPLEALQAFLDKYPTVKDVRVVKYALAVRLTRAKRYEEAAQLYQSINAFGRASRMRQLAALHHEATRTDLPPAQLQEAKYKVAAFIRSHPDGIYFNDNLWQGLQRYALYGDKDSHFTREERQSQIDAERKLKDDQEERWRAYQMLRGVVQDSGKTDLGRKAAQLAIQCVRGIARDRFGREDELRDADIELSKWLRQP